MKTKLWKMPACFVLCVALNGCVSPPTKPSAELAVAGVALAGSALENAELAGAGEHAPLELLAARTKKAAADKALSDRDYEKAQHLSVEARVDAELARAASDAEKSRRKLIRAQDLIEVLNPDSVPVKLPEADEVEP